MPEFVSRNGENERIRRWIYRNCQIYEALIFAVKPEKSYTKTAFAIIEKIFKQFTTSPVKLEKIFHPS